MALSSATDISGEDSPFKLVLPMVTQPGAEGLAVGAALEAAAMISVSDTCEPEHTGSAVYGRLNIPATYDFNSLRHIGTVPM